MKKLTCLLLCLSMVLSFASCKPKEDEEPDMNFPKVSSTEPVEESSSTANEQYKRNITVHKGIEGISGMMNDYSNIETTSSELIMGAENATTDVQMFMLSLSLYDMSLYPFFGLEPESNGDNSWTAVTDDENNKIDITKTGSVYNFFATALSSENYGDAKKYLFYIGSFDEDKQIFVADVYEGNSTEYASSMLSMRFECMNHEMGYLSQYAIFDAPGADDGIYLKGVFNEENCYVSMSPLSRDEYTPFENMRISTPRTICNTNYDFCIFENEKLAYNISQLQ